MKILIVEDRKEGRYLLEIMLKGSGYDVVSAINGEEALEKLRAEGFDMIISDILMPVMDGFQLCQQCKEDEELKDIPFVFYTAEYIEEGDENLALRLGVDKFIRKPIEPDEFVKSIKGVFRDVEEGKKKPVVAGMKILVVEDTEDNRDLLVKQLRAYGHEVMAAADGAEALEQALAQPPDIIVSDILMPKMDGYQLCQECKQNEQLKNIPLVFYTATYTLDEDEKFALSLGAATFLVKPTEPDALVQKLSEIVEKAKSGALAPAEVAPLEPSVFLAEHGKRIFAKLEGKVVQLEAEITKRKQAQEEVEHLYGVLHTIRSVNQLIAREKEQDKLLKSSCATLIKNRDYDSVCIYLFDKSGMLMTHAEAGLSKYFLTVVERLKRGESTNCVKRTLIQSDVVITKASSLTCGDCPLVKTCSSTKVVTVRIEHDERVYGLLKLQLSGDFSISREEQSLLQEVTEDIAFALHDMELEEERKRLEYNRKRLEYSLKERVKELQCLYGIADIAGRRRITLDELYQEAVNVIPKGWQYPEITCARIIIDDKKFQTENYRDTEWKQSADIKIGETKAGSVEVGYLEEMVESDEGPFVKEERALITAIAGHLGETIKRKQAEEMLQRSESTLTEAQRMAHIGSWELDIVANTLTWSDEIYRLFGLDPQQFGATYEAFLDNIHPDDREMVNKTYTESVRNKTPYNIVHRLLLKDGTVKYVNEKCETFYDDDGKPIRSIGTVHNITERKQAEEALRESGDKYRSLVNNVRLGIFRSTIGPPGKYLEVNPALEEITGYSRKELLHMDPSQLYVHPEERQATLEKIASAPGAVTGELKFRKKDGTEITVSSTISAIKDTTGKPLYFDGITEDITERKQAEEALQLAEQNFRNSLDSSPLGIRIVSAEGELLYANQAILDVCDYSSIEEVKAVPTKQRYTPESYAEHQERKERRKLGKPVSSNYEISIVRKDGEIRHLAVFRKEVTWGGEIQFQVLYQDITERKQAEETIKQTAEEWRTTFDSVTDLVSMHDKDFRLVRVNKAFADAVKKKPAELIGKHCYEIIHGTNKPVPNCPHKKTLEDRKPHVAEYFEPHLGFHLEVATSPIFNDKGELTASVHVARDITERKQVEEELKKHREHLEELVKERTGQLEEAVQVAEVASRAKSDFLASMSHELRTPLNAIIGFSQVLQEQYFGKLNEKQAEYVNDVLESGQHLLSLINDVLDLAKIEAGKMELELSGVKIKDLLESSLVMIKEKALVHGIKLDLDTTADLEGLEIMADQRRLKQVMFNLLSNAAKFTPDGGAITVKGKKEGKELIISVSDTGIGITPKEQERVFEEFYQATGGIKDKTPGTGLGLPLTRHIVEMHSGRIWVESEGLGKGSRFTFTLPV